MAMRGTLLSPFLPLAVWPGVADACSPPAANCNLYFDYKSAKISAPTGKMARDQLVRFQSVEPKCVGVAISVTSDPSELEGGKDVVGERRIAAAQRLLIDNGFLRTSIRATQALTAGRHFPQDLRRHPTCRVNGHYSCWQGALRSDDQE